MTTETKPDARAEAVREYARYCGGTSEYHRAGPRSNLLYTDGVLHLAEACQAHWLIDLIASHQPSIRERRPDLCGFQVWRVEATGGDRWTAEAWSDTPGDGGSILLARQTIGYSDFPEALSPYTGLWVESGILLLSAEH